MSIAHSEDRGSAASPGVYHATLLQYSLPVLRGIRDHLELRVAARSPAHLVRAIEEYLRDSAGRAAATSDLPKELRPALALLPFMPVSGWRIEEMRELLRYLGYVAPEKPLRAFLGLGLLALHAPQWRVETLRHFDLALNGWGGEQLSLVAHPALSNHEIGSLFTSPTRGHRQIRNTKETDGLEFVLRVAVLWQRIGESPLRLTQDSKLFKRGQERLGSDAVLSSPMFDEIAHLQDLDQLALILGKHLGLLVVDPEAESLRAHLGAAWQHELPKLLQGLWHELVATREWSGCKQVHDNPVDSHRLCAKRWLAMLQLAALEPDSWIALGELDRELKARDPERPSDFVSPGSRPFQVVVGRAVRGTTVPEPRPAIADWLESFLLGAMYQLSAVRVAENPSDGTPLVQLSPLGRWLLGVGPQPPSPPVYDKPLFVQPNHEVVVYRQGLSPELIGQLASFCRWKGLGAALTLELTPESVYRGLELGRTAEEMIGILERHSQRPLPPAVVDSMRTWSGRRERLRLYKQCTVLEFGSVEELDEALARGVPGDRLSDRLLLVAGDGKIPFDQFRLAGVRDYRQPPSLCVHTAEDGITWELELARSDLLVEHELARFAEPVAGSNSDSRCYRITPASLAAAARLGLRGAYLREWFRQRSGAELPASVELMLVASGRAPVELARLLALQTSTPAVADGIMQHPLTRQHVRRRIGPTALEILPNHYEELRTILQEMGIEVTGDTAEPLG